MSAATTTTTTGGTMTEQTTTTTTGAESAEDSHRTAHAAAHGVAAHLAGWCATDREAEAAAVARVPETSTAWPPAAQRANIRAGYARGRLAVAAARYAAAYIERELASDDAAYIESEDAAAEALISAATEADEAFDLALSEELRRQRSARSEIDGEDVVATEDEAAST